MCGISVCVSKKGKLDKKKFEAMTDIISYRGPDDRGLYFNGNIAMGHRRLSIIELSKDGHQPFELIDGYVLVFNGEIYNYIELREELQNKGHIFKTKTDTEVIIHSYEEWGHDCVKYFNGMWAFVLLDKKKNELFCSRDRFGIKPFYYTDQDGKFLVASEIKQFFEIIDGRPKANRDLLLQYIIRGTIERPPYTMFDEIYQLKPGQNLIYNITSNEYHNETYYSFGCGEYNKISYNDACKRFKTQFKRAIELQLRSDVPVGYFLSGGLDSSAIVTMADKILNTESNKSVIKQQTISICFNDKVYDEQEYIDEVTKTTNTVCHKIFPDEDLIFKELDDVIWHMDEPIAGTTSFSHWMVCKGAKQKGVKVVLNGQGADEQLAGYTDFYTVFFAYLLANRKFKRLSREVKAYLKTRAASEKHVSSNMVILSALKDCLIPKFLDRKIKEFYLNRIARIPFDKRIIKQAVKNEFIYPRRDPNAFIKAYMENELVFLLHREDRDSMAFSIESRVPFLENDLVDQLMLFPIEHKIRNGYTKAVMRDGLHGILPEKIEKRISKFGFVTPEDKWMNENKAFYRNELEIALNSFENLFDTDAVLKWFDNNRVKRGDRLIWRIIDASRWVKIFDVEI